MDLDKKIIKNREHVLSTLSVDMALDNGTVNIENILRDIKIEAGKLSIDGVNKKQQNNRTVVYSNLQSVSKTRQYLQKLNYKLSRYSWFNNRMKPVIKRIYKGRLMKSSIKVKQLLKYQDSQFVEMCYANILKRQVDENGYRSNLNGLRYGRLSKIEVIAHLSDSEEGKNINVCIKGMRWRFTLHRFFNLVFRIPILGRIIRYFYNIATINRTISSMRVWNINQDNYLEQLDFKINELKKEFSKHLSSTELLRDEITKYLGRTDCLEKGIDQHLGELDRAISSHGEQISTIAENTRNNNILIEKHENVISDEVERLIHDYNSIMVELCNLKAKSNCDYLSEKKEQLSTNYVVRDSDNKENNNYSAIDYFDFENHFRGSREHIKEVQKIYLPYFEGKENVIDLGCGRGEFLELLKDNGINSVGVDLFSPYVEFAKMNGLNVYCGDAIEFLKKQEKVGGIFVGQVVEHISTEQIVELCQVAYDKLEEGGYLIMETPNPTTLAIFTESFYIDPSHNKPVHPKTLDYLARKAGFSEVEIVFTESSRMPVKIPKLLGECKNIEEFNEVMGKVSDLLFGSQDYAVIARK